MSLSLGLKLADQHATFSAREVPVWWGRASQQLLLATIANDPFIDLDEIHDKPNRVRPYTASSLLGYTAPDGLQHRRAYGLRYTGLTKEVSSALLGASQGAWGLKKKLQLDGITFEITGHQIRRKTSKALLENTGRNRKISMRFTSPAYFKTKGYYQPMPAPTFVFRSLLSKWNTFSSVALNDDVLAYAEKCLISSGFSLETVHMEAKTKTPRFGAEGWITFSSISHDNKWQTQINTLAMYAEFAGVGAGTTIGAGQCAPTLGSYK